ncbi:MAG TPA: hypothetical protein VFW09_16335 [Solirubrobacteraceae bacterium]|nr:hypothetical protein [Solirubrobacteraceae bacterium]
MSIARRTIAWAVVALLWIALAAALTLFVSRLAAQRIGLASEPLSMLGGLAPPSAGPAAKRGAAGARERGNESATDRAGADSRTSAAPAAASSASPERDGADGATGGDD